MFVKSWWWKLNSSRGRKFFHMKSEWNVSGGKAFRVIGATCAIEGRLESSDCSFFIYIFLSLWSHASFLWYLIVECLRRKRNDVCTIAHWSVRSRFIVIICASTRHFCSVKCLTDFATFLAFGIYMFSFDCFSSRICLKFACAACVLISIQDKGNQT